nr:MAG TPA: tcix Putative treble-clef, zinc-finger, Zn-binding [Caudoviricetes sp.]
MSFKIRGNNHSVYASRIRPIQGSLRQKFAEDNNIKKCPALSCGALNLADYLLSSAKYLMVLTIWLV